MLTLFTRRIKGFKIKVDQIKLNIPMTKLLIKSSSNIQVKPCLLYKENVCHYEANYRECQCVFGGWCHNSTYNSS